MLLYYQDCSARAIVISLLRKRLVQDTGRVLNMKEELAGPVYGEYNSDGRRQKSLEEMVLDSTLFVK